MKQDSHNLSIETIDISDMERKIKQLRDAPLMSKAVIAEDLAAMTVAILKRFKRAFKELGIDHADYEG